MVKTGVLANDLLQIFTVFHVTLVALIPIDIFCFRVENCRHVWFDSDKACVIVFLKFRNDFFDVALAFTRVGVDWFNICRNRINAVFDVDVNDLLFYRMIEC